MTSSKAEIDAVKTAIATTLAPLRKDDQIRVLKDIQRRERDLTRLEGEKLQVQRRIGQLSEELVAWIRRGLRLHRLEGDCSSAVEVEGLVMMMANFVSDPTVKTTPDRAVEEILGHLSAAHLSRFVGWGLKWKDCGYARLACGAKLGAALMLTDAPDSVQAPWDAWSLMVPDGLIFETFTRKFAESMGQTWKPDAESVRVPILRLWCFGTEPIAALGKHGGKCYPLPSSEATDAESTWPELARNYVKGVCLTLDRDVERHRKGDWGPKRDNREPGIAPSPGADYVLGGTVTIDLRDEVTAICSGRTGHRPTVQFLVRGHWRNQATGPRHSERKRIWIEPFWKGPEDARVLLRTHRLESR